MALWPNNFRDIRGVFPTMLFGSPAFEQVQQRIQRQVAIFGNSNIEQTSAIPEGMAESPVCILQPIVSGGMSMAAAASGGMTANLLPSRSMSIDLTGSGDLEATAALVVSMIAAFSGSGALVASITGRLNATCNMTGSGDLEADMSGFANAVIAMTGTGDLEAAVAAFGDMSIDIVVTGTGLTTANVGPAVWNSIAAANNNPGTMGEKLNDAGSAANPWTEVIESGYTAAEILRILAAVMAGKSTGGATSNIEFTGLDGSTVRVDATVDENGNRTAVTLDSL